MTTGSQKWRIPKHVHFTIQSGERTKTKGNRVYRVHLVIDIHGHRRDRRLSHHRIVLNKSGILRIEEEGPPVVIPDWR